MKIKITHPIIQTVARETSVYTAGLTYDVKDEQAREWIERGWAYQIQTQESPEREPLPAAEVKHKRQRRVK